MHVLVQLSLNLTKGLKVWLLLNSRYTFLFCFILFLTLFVIILQSKKVLDNKFDELPLYGLGSCKSANWWKSLGDDLLSMGMPCVVFVICD